MNKLVVLLILLSSFGVYAQSETQLRMYRPFTPGVQQPALRPVKTVEGHCDSQSVFMPRQDAWHCTSPGGDFDPCFAMQKGNGLICPSSPWHSEATLITPLSLANNSLFSEIDMARGKPWAIEMRDGLRCLAVEETEQRDNQPVRYVCGGGSQLIGELHRCKMQWSVLWSDGKTSEEKLIKTAWY